MKKSIYISTLLVSSVSLVNTLTIKKLAPLLMLVPTISLAQLELDSKNMLGAGASILGGKVNPTTMAMSRAGGFAESQLQNSLSKLLSNTEVSVTGIREGKPTIGIITVRPLYESVDLKDTVFGQFSFFNSDGRQTVNMGMGYRQLSKDKNWLYGINAFYDQEFPYNHQRSSVGLELRSSVFEINSNQYFSLSNWRVGQNGLMERALGGSDFELGFILPYMPGAKIYRKYYRWDTYDGLEDIKGDVTSLEINGDILVPGLRLEVGVNEVKGSNKKSEFARLMYRYMPGYKSSPAIFSDVAYRFKSMEDRRLDKVRRTNTIVKQTSGNFVIEIR